MILAIAATIWADHAQRRAARAWVCSSGNDRCAGWITAAKCASVLRGARPVAGGYPRPPANDILPAGCCPFARSGREGRTVSTDAEATSTKVKEFVESEECVMLIESSVRSAQIAVYELLGVSLQCFGGSGYCSDYPIEQYIRDQKIDTLYEGTTHIQALDLVGRKLAREKVPGAAMKALLAENELQATAMEAALWPTGMVMAGGPATVGFRAPAALL